MWLSFFFFLNAADLSISKKSAKRFAKQLFMIVDSTKNSFERTHHKVLFGDFFFAIAFFHRDDKWLLEKEKKTLRTDNLICCQLEA